MKLFGCIVTLAFVLANWSCVQSANRQSLREERTWPYAVPPEAPESSMPGLRLANYDDFFKYQPQTRPMHFEDYRERQAIKNTYGQVGDAYGTKTTMTQELIDELYEQLEAVHPILKKHGIKYSVEGGTLLGALRNGGVIPGDDDVDLIIHNDDRAKFESDAVQDDLKKIGFFSKNTFFGKKVKKDGSKGPALDITFLEETSDGKMRPASKRAQLHFDGFWFDAKYWKQSFEEVPFGHLKVSILPLEGSLHLLNNMYGGDWNVSTYKIWDHVTSRPTLWARKTALLPGKNGDYYHIPHSSQYKENYFAKYRVPEFTRPPEFNRVWTRKLTVPRWVVGATVAGTAVVGTGIVIGSVFAVKALMKKYGKNGDSDQSQMEDRTEDEQRFDALD